MSYKIICILSLEEPAWLVLKGGTEARDGLNLAAQLN